jgi:regulator of sigma E protease
VLTLVAFLIVIGVLVFVHELGHLIAAKSVDIEVPRFSIGFGPRVAGFQWGETEYVISALPLGGYVRMAGMEDTAALEGGEDPEHTPSSRDFDAKPLWARAWVVSAGVIMNFLFAILVIAGVGFFVGEPVISTTRVAVANVDEIPTAGAPLERIPLGATLEAVGGQAVENWNEVVETLSTAPAGPVELRFADAPPVSLTLAADDSARIAVLRHLEPYRTATLGEVSPGSPAAEAGLEPGDQVVAAAGQPVRTWSEFVEIIQANPGRAVPLQVERGGSRIALTVTPEGQRELNVDMERVEIGRIGVAQQRDVVTYHPLPLGESLSRGAQVTWETSGAIVSLLGDLFTGDASPRSLGGPLAIGQLSGQAARFGAEAFFQFMALLSVNLAVLNLLPIPVLDGGQLLFIIVEAVRGRPLSVEQRLRLSHVGLIIVVGIMVWAITNDFLRFFGI